MANDEYNSYTFSLRDSDFNELKKKADEKGMTQSEYLRYIIKKEWGLI